MSTLTDDGLTSLLAELASSYDVPEHGSEAVLAALADEPAARPVLRRRWVQLSAAAALVIAGGVFAAAQYGGGASSNTRAAEPPAARAGTGTGAASAPGALTHSSLPSAAKALSSSTGSAGSAGAAVGEPRAPMAAAPAPMAAPPVDAPAPDGGDSRVVKSGSISLVVKDKQVTPILSAVQQAATSEGGYISSSSSDEYGDTPSGEVSIRVPVDRFEALVAKVRGLDAKVRTATTSGKDVTAQYSDLESQLRTLTAARDRFLVILSKTKTISEILTVQQRVDDVTGQIDRIEGQRKLLANQSDLSTLTVSVSEAGDPVVTATTKPRSGLSQAIVDAKDGFVGGVEAIIRHSGGFLLFLICAGLVLLVGRLGWRVARRRMV